MQWSGYYRSAMAAVCRRQVHAVRCTRYCLSRRWQCYDCRPSNLMTCSHVRRSVTVYERPTHDDDLLQSSQVSELITQLFVIALTLHMTYFWLIVTCEPYKAVQLA